VAKAPSTWAGPFTEEKARAACRLLEGAVQAATYILFAMAELDRGKAGMGTTISAMMRFGDSVVLGQVGDSRIYRVAHGRRAAAHRRYHTLIAWQLKQGLITPDQARTSKQRNVITRAVGKPRLCSSRYECLGSRSRGFLPALQRRSTRLPKA